jgi:predicted secreted protein
VCKNAGTVLKSALLREICQRLANQQNWDLHRRAILAPHQATKTARKRFYTASAKSCRSMVAAGFEELPARK